MPSVTLIMLLLLLVMFFVFMGAKFGGRALALLLAAGGVSIVGLALIRYVSLKNVAVNVRSGELQQEATSRAKALEITSLASTEEMWEHLNRSRIVLDSEEEATETEEPEDVENTKAETSSEQNRPAWVDSPPKRVGNIYRVVVSSERYRDVEECHRALGPMLSKVVMQRVSQLADSDDSPSFEQLGLGLEFVLREICLEECVETVENSFGEMKVVHVLMEFDAAVDKQLRAAYRSYQRETRIAKVGGIAGLGIGGLALLFGLLKADTWTRGYYTKRLFFGVPAAIIGLILLFIA